MREEGLGIREEGVGFGMRERGLGIGEEGVDLGMRETGVRDKGGRRE